jgi:hypothetical protein
MIVFSAYQKSQNDAIEKKAFDEAFPNDRFKA